MKGGVAVSPVVAGVVIVLALAVVGVLLFVRSSSGGRVQLNPDQVKQMQQMMGQQKDQNAVGRTQRSLPPGTGAK